MGIGSGSLAALAPVPDAPSVVLTAPGNTWETVCFPPSLPLASSVLPGNAPVLRVDYYDGAALIGSRPMRSIHLPLGYAAVIWLALHHGPSIRQVLLQCNLPARGTVVLTQPASNHLAIQLSPDGAAVVCCLGGTTSNAVYTIESATNLLNRSTAWLPFSTNTAISDLLVFTNSPLAKARYFRAATTP